MIDKKTIFEIHRLKNMGLSVREIERRLQVSRKTIANYLENPELKRYARTPRDSKLDKYKPMIQKMLQEYPKIKAPVVLREISDKGFNGEITIVRGYLRELRRNESYGKEPFIRFESQPGEQMQVDWGHFKTIEYGDTKRKLYALAIVECHSRMLHVTFTHSQKQDVLHQCLLNAFNYFGGTPKELVVDNMITAVTERLGSIIRFNDAFLDFLIKFNINPIACNVRAPYEKGKIESAIKYLRNNFIPAKTFNSLEDINQQACEWLNNTANIRVHKTTGEKPFDRLYREKLTPLPNVLPDCRETETLKVHKDFGVRFDKNTYTVPPTMVSKKVTLKADYRNVTIYYKEKQIAFHKRSWGACHRLETKQHVEQAKKIKKQSYLDRDEEVFLSLGDEAYTFLEKLKKTDKRLKKIVTDLLKLKDEYGDNSLLYAMKKAMNNELYGVDYVKNILFQEMTPEVRHQPVTLENEELNNIRLTTPSLKEYDAIALKRRRQY